MFINNEFIDFVAVVLNFFVSFILIIELFNFSNFQNLFLIVDKDLTSSYRIIIMHSTSNNFHQFF